MPTAALKSLPGPDGGSSHEFVVCTGESCLDAGSRDLLEELRHECQHARGDLRVCASRCLGHCQLAPAIVEDGRILGAVNPRRIKAELSRLGLL